MKKIILSALLLVPGLVSADTCAKTLMPTFTSAQATKLCSSFGTSSNHSIIPTTTNLYTLGDATHNWANVFTRILTFGGTTSKIVPGSTSLSLRNNADSADNVLVADAGTVSVRSHLTPATDNAVDLGASSFAWRNITANNLLLNGTFPKLIPGSGGLAIRNNANAVDNFVLADAGSLKISQAQDLIFNVGLGTVAMQEAVAGTACMGGLTANGATPVVTSTTCATTGSRIFLSRTSAETGTVNAWVSALSTGVSFSITSEAADTGTYNWIIFHESP